MLEARYQADLKKLQDEGHPEKLTRTELAAKKAEFQQAAREGVAKRLAGRYNAKREESLSPDETAALDELLKWFRIERMDLNLKLGRNLDQVAKDCWAMLGDQPQPEKTEETVLDERQLEAARRQLIEDLRKQRAFSMLNYLAVRRSAAPELVARLKKFIAAGLKLKGEAAAPWKRAEFALLIALDQPEELERQLTQWIRTDPFPAPWQLALGRLSAERGKLAEAIRLLETVQRERQLSPADYAALANWYLVVDRKDDYRRSKVEIFKSMPEYQIVNWIYEKRELWSQTDQPLPAELDENVLFAFQALFEKSNQPENYVYELREFYAACRDFRLLQMIPDALTGRTPQQIYPFLKSLQSNLLSEIRKEATADEILKRLAEVRAGSESPVDLRALDLLEALIERRSSEVLNQPGPHIAAAVQGLQRAFEREWAEGEVRQMADLLDTLGTIKQAGLNAERLRELRELHKLTKPGGDDRLFVSWHLAHALFWSHSERDESLGVMQIAIREYEQTHPDGWPASANTPLDGYADLLEAARRFAETEEVLTAQIKHPANPTQKHWMIQRQNRCYHKALQEEGLVSLGSGETLYQNLQKHLLNQAAGTADENFGYQAISLLLQVYSTAKEKKFAYEADLRNFAFKKLPELLKKQTKNDYNLITQTAESLQNLIGPRVRIEVCDRAL